MKACILFHDNCFDGLVSAGLFYSFAKQKIDPNLEVIFGGLRHDSPKNVDEGPVETGYLYASRLVGDLNAIVDFRYLADERLTWWFDHHRSAFRTEEDKRHFESDTSGKKYFDPSAPSCAGFLSRMLARDYAMDIAPFDELIHWAQIIDSASFPDPETAVELKEPALKLMTWIENSKSFDQRRDLICQLIQEPLESIVQKPYIASEIEPLFERHRYNIEAMRASIVLDGDVAWSDLTSTEIEGVNKFIAYYLHPEAKYAVVVSRAKSRSKISVGYNPWAPPEDRKHDISQICREFGGGGHAVVGAISLPTEDVDRAVEISREVVSKLKVG